jgi:hypothetical protein
MVRETQPSQRCHPNTKILEPQLPPGFVHVKSYRDVLREYVLKPEHKCNGPDRQPCKSTTTGVLQRKTIRTR